MSNKVKEVLQEQQDEKYPMLHGFDYGRRWLDGLISIIEAYLLSMSSILLTVAGGMSMFAFLTGGLSFQPGSQALNFWALIQTVAVDMQFSVMWYKAAQSWRSRKFFPAIGYAFLGCILSVVLFEAYAVPSMESTMQRDFQATMNSLGFDPKMMVFIRSGVAIMLMVVGATNRTFFVFSRDGKAQHIGGQNVHSNLALLAASQQGTNQPQVTPILAAKQTKKSFFSLPTWGKKKDKKSAVAPAKNEQDENEKMEEAGAAAPANLSESNLRILQVAPAQPAAVEEENLQTSQEETAPISARVEEEIEAIIEAAQTPGSSEVLEGSDQNGTQENPPAAPVLAGSVWEQFSSQEPAANQGRTNREPAPVYAAGSFSNSAPAQTGAAARRAPVRSRDERDTPSGEFPAVGRLIGMTLEEVYELDIVKQVFNRVDSRKKAVDNAYKSGALLRKSDQSVTKNAVVEWLKTVPKKES